MLLIFPCRTHRKGVRPTDVSDPVGARLANIVSRRWRSARPGLSGLPSRRTSDLCALVIVIVIAIKSRSLWLQLSAKMSFGPPLAFPSLVS